MQADLSKYQRQIALKSFGLKNQHKLLKSNVLIVGMGGLGIPVAQYLNAMGIGSLGIMDRDTINVHNLHRQVLYLEEEVGQLKVEIAAKKLKQQNSHTHIKAIPEFLNKDNALHTIAEYDVVVDASDNFATRYLVNDACVILGKPFVYGALHDFEGQVSVFNYSGGPTYRCLFPQMPQLGEIPNCNENGVLGVLPGVIGSLQAMETIKVLSGIGEVLSGKLLLFNGLTMKNRLVQFKRRSDIKRITSLQENYGSEICNSIATISAHELLGDYERKQLIDVRRENEFKTDHLENALNIPLQDLEDSMDKINFERSVYLICQSGKRSTLAAQMLTKLYPESLVYTVQGGMNQISALCR